MGPTGGWIDVLLAGVVAGLGVAVPVGAVGVLVVQEALARGRAHGVAAASGVATTDLLYAGVAALAGAAVADWIGPRAEQVRWVAAVVLAAVAGRGLREGWRTRRACGSAHGAADAGTGRGPSMGTSADRGDAEPGALPPRRERAHGLMAAGLRFAGVTVVNPATVAYLAVVVSGLSGALDTGADRAAFAAGVFAGSWCWHAMVAAAAATAGSRLSTSARAATGVVGHGLVLVLAAGMVLRG